MVVDLLTDDRADRVFHALADATRRDRVDQMNAILAEPDGGTR